MSARVAALLRAAGEPGPRGARLRQLARELKDDPGFQGAFSRADPLGDFTVLLRAEAAEVHDEARLGAVLCRVLDPYQQSRERDPGVPRRLTLEAAELGTSAGLEVILLWDEGAGADVTGPAALLGGLLVEPGAALLGDPDLYLVLRVFQLALARELFADQTEEYRAALEMVNALLPPRVGAGADLIPQALAEFRHVVPFDAVAVAVALADEGYRLQVMLPEDCPTELAAGVRREMCQALGTTPARLEEEARTLEGVRVDPEDLAGGMESLCVLPLVGAQGEDCGRIGFFSLTAGFFTTHHLELLGLLAPSVGLAAQAAHDPEGRRQRAAELESEAARVEAQLGLAARLQTQLLAPPPEPPPGLQVAARSDMSAAVGGDFFAASRVGEGTYVAAVADVSGKGLPAGIVMAHTLGALRAAWDSDPAPGEVMRHMNQVVCLSTDDYSFVTMAVLLVDAASGRVRLASAGHEPVLRLRPDGSREELTAGDAPLGILEGQAFREVELELAPGERLVLTSDGIVDALDPAGERFERARLAAALEAAPPDAAGTVAALFGAVEAFVKGRPLKDDATALVLARPARV